MIFQNPHRKFDLKGSTVDREASDKELDKNLPTFKDNDFINQGIRLLVGEQSKTRLMDTLSADVNVSCLCSLTSHIFKNTYGGLH